MINKFSVAKALLDNAQSIADVNGYDLVPEGSEYTADPNTAYIQEFCLYGDDNMIGMAAGDNDIQFGVYQININTPKSMSGAKWLALNIAGIYQSGFAKTTQLTHNEQSLKILDSSLKQLSGDDTHMQYVLSINFSVIN